jgi:hypothetical protein
LILSREQTAGRAAVHAMAGRASSALVFAGALAIANSFLP